MKKLITALLALALLLSAALGESNAVDVDLTQMSDTGAIDALYDMLDAPEENQGKTAKVKGYAYSVEDYEDETWTCYVILDDPSSCCGGPQIEFVPTKLPEGFTPSRLDTAGKITVIGTLQFGDGGYMDVRLVDAAVLLPVI